MKRYSLILCMVLIVSLPVVASAQIVLGPPPAAVGGANYYYLRTTVQGATTTTFSTLPDIQVGGISYTGVGFSVYVAFGGAVEFNLGPAMPPTFTATDFTARLDGLTVTTSFATGAMDPLDVDLFNMPDGDEDGVITVDDFIGKLGRRIDRQTHMFSQAGTADFNNIDVTCAVRNDLFGAGQTNFSGFILLPANISEEYKVVLYDPDTPTLTINPGVPGPKCGGGGGGGGGGCFIATATR
jgi:hypothetical protein